jgi:hypothetical protein
LVSPFQSHAQEIWTFTKFHASSLQVLFPVLSVYSIV